VRNKSTISIDGRFGAVKSLLTGHAMTGLNYLS